MRGQHAILNSTGTYSYTIAGETCFVTVIIGFLFVLSFLFQMLLEVTEVKKGTVKGILLASGESIFGILINS